MNGVLTAASKNFSSIGVNFTIFFRSASSVDRVSEQIYSQQAFYIYYTYDDAVLERFPEYLMAEVAASLEQQRVNVDMQTVSCSKPTDCSEIIMSTIEPVAATLDYASKHMPSGSGHDAVYVKPTGPIGMIFIPCLDGRSRCPEEWVEPRQLLDGKRVLYQTVVELDRLLKN